MSIFANDMNSGVATDVDNITTSDSAEQLWRMIYVGGSGNLKVTTWDGNDRTIAVTAGYEFKCAVKKVWATGTTATGLIGFR